MLSEQIFILWIKIFSFKTIHKLLLFQKHKSNSTFLKNVLFTAIIHHQAITISIVAIIIVIRSLIMNFNENNYAFFDFIYQKLSCSYRELLKNHYS